MEEDHDYDYSVDLRIEDVRTLHYCVQEAIRDIPGAPARPGEEQEHMRYLRDSLIE